MNKREIQSKYSALIEKSNVKLDKILSLDIDEADKLIAIDIRNNEVKEIRKELDKEYDKLG